MYILGLLGGSVARLWSPGLLPAISIDSLSILSRRKKSEVIRTFYTQIRAILVLEPPPNEKDSGSRSDLFGGGSNTKIALISVQNVRMISDFFLRLSILKELIEIATRGLRS